MSRVVLPTTSGAVRTRPLSLYELQQSAEDHEGRVAVIEALNPPAGVAAGYKIARGSHQQAAASDTIATGLTTVVAVVLCWRDTPTAKQTFLTATIGDQAGTPAAGSFLSKTFKSTYAAADDFTDNLTFYWIAIGT